MDLDFRKQKILQAIVQDYIVNAEPVGSHVLVERYALGVKSATIRNEMAEMSERGFLRQPHTSSGRIPANLGYRFFVDRLMVPDAKAQSEANASRAAVENAASDLEAILRKTCQLLSSLTRLPAVATSPDADDTFVARLFLTPAGGDRLLMVALLSSGRTEHRLLTGVAIDANEGVALANALNDRFVGATLARLRNVVEPTPAGLPVAPALWDRLVRELGALGKSVSEDAPVFVESTPDALSQPEFRDVERLSTLLRLLQERAALVEVLLDSTLPIVSRNASNAGEVSIRIGDELGRADLSEFALVTSSYYVGARERGRIGVLGPMRMDYARATVAVKCLAATLTEVLAPLVATA